MSRYIDDDLLKDKTTRVNNIWNSTTNAEGKGLDEIIDDIPTADVRENVKGEWIKLDMHAHLADHKCSACGQECYVPTCMGDPMYVFCPNCGADMRREDNGRDEENNSRA